MRSSFDKLISWTGTVVAAVLLFAGGLLMWASSFATSNVPTSSSPSRSRCPSLPRSPPLT